MRFGAVSYLNSRPLVEGLSPLVLDTPARLVERFEAGGLDVALLPVVAGEGADLVRIGRLGIAADGAVASVLLLLRDERTDPLATIGTLAFDPASRTSNVLAQVLVRDRCGRLPRIVEDPREADAEVVIGDRALTRARTAPTGRCLDLGALWKLRTGLPFVFAAWYGDPAAEPELEAAYARGRARIADYAREASLPGLDAGALESYLRERIVFRLDEPHRAGLARFVEEGKRFGLL